MDLHKSYCDSLWFEDLDLSILTKCGVILLQYDAMWVKRLRAFKINWMPPSPWPQMPLWLASMPLTKTLFGLGHFWCPFSIFLLVLYRKKVPYLDRPVASFFTFFYWGGGGGVAYFTGPPLAYFTGPPPPTRGRFAIFTLKWSDLVQTWGEILVVGGVFLLPGRGGGGGLL